MSIWGAPLPDRPRTMRPKIEVDFLPSWRRTLKEKLRKSSSLNRLLRICFQSPPLLKTAAENIRRLGDTAPLDTSAIPLQEWDTASMQADIFDMHSAQAPNSEETEPEPMLREILSVVTACNTTITSLYADIKGVKAEVPFIHQDMQKLRDCTAALEGWLSTRGWLGPSAMWGCLYSHHCNPTCGKMIGSWK